MEKQPEEKPVEKAAEKAAEAPKEAPKAEKPKKKKTGLIIGIIIALLAIAGGVVAAILLLNKGDTSANDETVSNIIADIIEKKDIPNTEFKGNLKVEIEGVKVSADLNGKYADKKMATDLAAKINVNNNDIAIKASLASDGETMYLKLNGMPDLSGVTGDAASAAMISMFIKEGTWYSMPAEMTTGMTGQVKISGGANCGSIDMQQLMELAKGDKSWLTEALRDSKFISLEKAEDDMYKVFVNREETVKLIKNVNSKVSSATKCDVLGQVNGEGMAEKEEIPGLLLGFRNGQISKVKYENAEMGATLELNLSYPGGLTVDMPSDAQSLSDLFGGMFGGSSFGGYDYDYDYDDDDDDDDIDWSSWLDDYDDDDDDDDDDFDAESYINSLLEGKDAESLQKSLEAAEKALESIDLDSLESLLNGLQ
jgi:flagellar basal body-associated protein FliL